jgi:hypothetical protein
MAKENASLICPSGGGGEARTNDGRDNGVCWWVPDRLNQVKLVLVGLERMEDAAVRFALFRTKQIILDRLRRPRL